MRRSGRTTLLVVGVAGLMVALTALAHRVAEGQRSAFPPEEDLVYLPRTSVLRALSLGHPEMMADLVFLRTITYYTSQFFGSRDFSWLRRHVDTVNDLDPRFRAPYMFAARASLYNGSAISNDNVFTSNHFLERGLEQFPSDWEMAFALACNYLVELHTNDPKQREEWRRASVRWIRQAALAGGGPEWLPNLAATIMSEEGQVEASIRYLEEAYLTTNDDRTREEIRRLLSAKRKSDVAKLTAARDALATGWKRTLPYAPSDLYLLVGDQPSARLDWRYLTRNASLDQAASGE